MKHIFVLFLATAWAVRAADLAGHTLLVTSVRTGDTEVFIADPTSGDLFNVSRSPKSEDRYPCWSPDGRQIVFMSDRESTTNLWLCNVDGSNVRRLLTSPDVCYMPSWQRTPQGERIVFGMHGDKPNMASIRPDGTDLVILGEGHDPTLSPDGKLICYTGHPPEGGVTVYVMSWDGSEKRRLVPSTSQVGATFPNWSPDAKRIVYSFPVGDALELFLINLDGTGQSQLTTFGAPSVCTPAAWSPDGKWISFRRTDERYWSNPERMRKVYSEKPADKRPVWVIRPDGSEATVIEPLRFQMAIDGSRASWKPNGRRMHGQCSRQFFRSPSGITVTTLASYVSLYLHSPGLLAAELGCPVVRKCHGSFPGKGG
jgi:TolB protein